MATTDDLDPHYIVHLVMLDEDLPSCFRSTSAEKADEARRLLTEAFGYERVTVTSLGESDLDEYRDVVRMWAADPRLRRPAR